MTDRHQSNGAVKVLVENRAAILEGWIMGQQSDHRIRVALFGNDQRQLRQQCESFVNHLIVATQAGVLENITAPEIEPVKRAASDIIETRERMGFTPFESAAAIICLKDSWGAVLTDAYKKEPESLKRETVTVAKLVDTIALSALEGAIQRREKIISQQTTTILELSTPVIQVWNGVIVVPLIGSLDTQRAQRLTDQLLQRIVETASPVALLDVTGVPAIDTKSAQHIVEALSAVRLLGADIVLTGLRPAIAQTLVHLGIDLKNIVSRSSLAAGLRYAFEILNLDVVQKQSAR
jgi:rsbT co-antagonist protein RsbR